MPETTKTTYTTAAGVSLWRRSGTISIVSIHDTRIAVFPMSFLASCGDNSWEYINYVVTLLIDVDPNHPGQLFDENGTAVNEQVLPTPGIFRYIERGMFLQSSRRKLR